MRKTAAFLLAAALLLSGCGAAPPPEPLPGPAEAEPEYYYRLRASELPDGLSVSAAAVHDGSVYIAASGSEVVSEGGTDRMVFSAELLRLDTGTGSINTLSGLQTGGSTDVLVQDMAVCGDIWLLLSRRGEAESLLQRLSPDGAVLGEWPQEHFTDAGLHISGLAALPGSLCILCDGADGSQLRVFDISGTEPLFCGSAAVPSGCLVEAAGDGLLLGRQGETGYVLLPFDTERLEPGDEVQTVVAADRHLVSPEGSIYLETSSTLMEYDGGSVSPLLSYVSCGVSSVPLCAAGSGTFFTAEPCGLLERAENTGDVSRITLAVTRQDDAMSAYLTELAARFNSEGRAFRIELLDYTIYNVGGDGLAGTVRLAADMLEGRFPDMLMLSGLPVQAWAKRGLLLDIDPFIDADFDRSELYDNWLHAAELDGGLYCLPVGWSVWAAGASHAHADGYEGLSFADVDAIMSADPMLEYAFSQGISRQAFLETALSFNASALMDWESRTCDFTSGLFEDILRYAAMQPEEAVSGDNDGFGFEWDYDEAAMLASGRQLFYVGSAEPGSMQLFSERLGEDFTLCGFPGEGRGLAVEPLCPVGVSAATEHPDECREFLKTLLTDSGILRRDAAGLSATERNGLAAFEAAEVIYGMDAEALGIIADAAAPYFAGEKSAPDVAAEVQSRVATYMAEQG